MGREKVEREFAGLYKELGLGLTTWSPLASGLLTGKYSSGIPAGSRASLKGYEWLQEKMVTPERIALVTRLEPIARELGCTLGQLAIAWCLRNENVSTVILGASNAKQLIENLAAKEYVSKINGALLKEIEAILASE